jgi:hypothetical protein
MLWPSLEAFCPVWRTYRERSGRDLRVFALRGAPTEHAPATTGPDQVPARTAGPEDERSGATRHRV